MCPPAPASAQRSAQHAPRAPLAGLRALPARPRERARGGGLVWSARARGQVLHYHDGQRYEQHHDFLVDAINPSPEHGGQRLVTFLMYLTTVEEGGETVFPMVRCGAALAPAMLIGLGLGQDRCVTTLLGAARELGACSAAHNNSSARYSGCKRLRVVWVRPRTCLFRQSARACASADELAPAGSLARRAPRCF